MNISRPQAESFALRMMTPPLEVWGGHECTVNRVGDIWRDQTRLTGHQDRITDLELFAGLGLKSLRYPVLWERTEIAPGVFDWSWADARLGRLRDLGIRPIIGLLHHGSGPAWTDLLDPEFAGKFAAFAGEVARRYPWIEDWTPINEPLTTARFSALYGLWYPHSTGERDFWRALASQLLAIRAAMDAIRRVNSGARLIQTEDFGHTWSTGPCAGQALYENRRRLAAWDVLSGRMTGGHPLVPHLRRLEVADLFASFSDAPCPPDVIGFNHYVTSDRFLDHRLERYPAQFHGGNGVMAYADVEAVRVVEELPRPWLEGFRVLHARYRTPIAVTECHIGCSPPEQVRWLLACWQAAIAARSEGISVVAITPWALLGSYDWDSLLTGFSGRYEPGVYEIVNGEPRATALTGVVRQLSAGGTGENGLQSKVGWWARPDRLLYPGWTSSVVPASDASRARDHEPASPGWCAMRNETWLESHCADTGTSPAARCLSSCGAGTDRGPTALIERTIMSDDKSKTGGQDRDRISLTEDYEVRDWTRKFGVSEERLRAAVNKVGDVAVDVQRELTRS